MKTMKKRNVDTFLLCFFAFFLTIACYQSWIYHMMDLSSTWSLELLSTTASFLFQALGVLIYMFFAYFVPDLAGSKLFITFVYMILSLSLIPSMFSETLTGTYFNGFIMNILCGAIWGMVLYGITYSAKANLRFFILGGGYLLGAGAVYCTTLVKGDLLTKTPLAFLMFVGIAIVATFFSIRATGNVNPLIAELKAETERKRLERKERNEKRKAEGRKRRRKLSSHAKEIIIPSVLVFLFSIILHLGNNFLAPGEGFLQILGVSYDAVSPLVLAGIFYFFFWVLTIGRGLWFAKLSDLTGKLSIYALGFLFGRLGDAVGTGIWRLLYPRMMYIRFILAGCVLLILLFLVSYGAILKGKTRNLKELLDKDEAK